MKTIEELLSKLGNFEANRRNIAHNIRFTGLHIELCADGSGLLVMNGSRCDGSPEENFLNTVFSDQKDLTSEIPFSNVDELSAILG